MDKEELQQWAQQLGAELDRLRQQRAQLETEIQQTAKKLELVNQMLALESGDPVARTVENKATPIAVRDFAKVILTDAARPLHINEIHRAFREHGYPIPGGGTPFNILIHLTKDKGFVRVARGTYALPGMVAETDILPNAPRRAPRRKRRSGRAKE